ncbi:hypothetical protein TPHA_0D03450 [Tetrapisispora phaffii CBS 4417]|uniref:Uncharacterized protein n=1 Tax=Tetrapisispora phaffii (strain ATCC 24235 / CBS 4417 / NBRC 1672 / NRRL Y-8282 / UCD 70-5) TaxID=1071381 RepID=G8BT09_TETPH|nr:hypothetical protein TPHA_0D03450 [Tetrapisispora phaffii CBS 4417]CCE62980.1 hypothetical protein TPHA_0D03450 [Tetrapisispora phaffii CBS 4417]
MVLPVTPSKNFHRQSNSQVRFSLPDLDDVKAPENIHDIKDSPTKIVYPSVKLSGPIESFNTPQDQDPYKNRIGSASSMDRENTQLLDKQIMDLSSNIMIQVPRDVWRYHNEKLNRNASNKNDSATYKHKKQKSLQSIIVNTINSLNTTTEDAEHTENSFDVSDISNVSPLRLNSNSNHNRTKSLPLLTAHGAYALSPEKTPNLYLTTDSPLNKFNVPIPLQISIPPYLSPKNKNKIPNTLVYDGAGYSTYEESYSESISELSNQDKQELNLQDSNCSSILDASSIESIVSSIASAEHKITLNIFNEDNNNDDDIDNILGIDQYANVNLKLQNRNLRNRNFKKQNENNQTQINMPPLPVLYSHSVDNKNITNQKIDEGIAQDEESNSLAVLSTPVKYINIPDLEKDKTTKTKNGTLRFFDNYESSMENISPKFKLSDNEGQLSKTFKFPNNPKANEPDRGGTSSEVTRNNTIFPVINKDNNDFIKIDNSTVTDEFEKRRQMLQQNRLSPNNKNMKHAHRRSRSIHNADDIFTSSPEEMEKSQKDVHSGDMYTNDVNAQKFDDKSTLNFSEDSNITDNLYPETTTLSQEKIENKYHPQTGETYQTTKSKQLELAINEVSEAVAQKEDKILTINVKDSNMQDIKNNVEVTSEISTDENIETEISSLYEDSDSNSIVPSFVAVTDNSKYDSSLDNMTNYSYQSMDADVDNSKVLLSDISKEEPIHQNRGLPCSETLQEEKFDNYKVSANIDKIDYKIKPLSSFNSFPIPLPSNRVQPITTVPISKMTLIENQVTEVNSSPTRALSDSDSLQSHNSEFSKTSYQTSVSSYNQTETMTVKIGKRNIVGTSRNIGNNNFEFPTSRKANKSFKREIIRQNKKLEDLPYRSIEEHREGKPVEVIILDEINDTEDKLSHNNTVKMHQNSKSLGQFENVKFTDINSKNHVKLKNRNSIIHKRTNSCPSREELLQLCETVAEEAKGIIYGLVNQNINNATLSQNVQKPSLPNLTILKNHSWKVVSPNIEQLPSK